MRPLPIVHRRARLDVEEIAARIAVDQILAALRFVDATQAAFDLLAEFPGIGPRWHPGIPKFPEPGFWTIKGFRNFLVFYLPVNNAAEIIGVIHGARDISRIAFS